LNINAKLQPKCLKGAPFVDFNYALLEIKTDFVKCYDQIIQQMLRTDQSEAPLEYDLPSLLQSDMERAAHEAGDSVN
jgi:hypothetical protein